MSRRPARFTEADVRRAAKVAKQLGLAVEIAPDGTIRLVPETVTKGTEAAPQEREIVL
jgi:hypothetical protein